MQQRQFWVNEIQHERLTLRVLIWYIRAMVITYTCFSSCTATDTDKSALIESLERYQVASSIESEAISIYNDFFRLHHPRAVIVHHDNPDLNGKLVAIKNYDISSQTYIATLLDSPCSIKEVTIDPGHLRSASLAIHSPSRWARGLQRRLVTIVSEKSEEQISYKFDFDVGCFKSFSSYYDHSKVLQSDETYQAFLLFTKSVSDEGDKSDRTMNQEQEQFVKAMSILGHQEMVESVLQTESYEHVFTFPFRSDTNVLHNASRNIGIFDRALDSSFNDSKFEAALSSITKVPVDHSAFRCLLPQQRITDAAMYVLSSW